VHLFEILKHLETKLPRSAKNITFMTKILSKPHIGISGWKMERVHGEKVRRWTYLLHVDAVSLVRFGLQVTWKVAL